MPPILKPVSANHFFEMSEELKPFVPDYDYLLFDLSDMSEEQIKGEIRLRVGFLLFKYIQDERLRHELPRILRLIAELTQKESALQYLQTVLRYVSRGTDKITQEELKQIVKEAFPEGEPIMATIAEVWREEGERKGRREGKEEGKREGKREIARTMLVKGMEISLISEITGLKEEGIYQKSSHSHNGSQ